MLSTSEADLGPEDAHEDAALSRDSQDDQGADRAGSPQDAARATAALEGSLPASTTPQFTGPSPMDPSPTAATTYMEEELQQLPLGGRPNRKHITLRSFLSGPLCDLAADWFIHFKRENPTTTLEAAGHCLVAQFSSPLRESALRRALMEMRKRRAETYSEYASRLMDAADSLPGGVEDETNCRQAVYAFVEHAHPKFELDLDRIARKKLVKAWKARAVLYHIVTELVALAKSNSQSEAPRPKPVTKTGIAAPVAVPDQRQVKRAKGDDVWRDYVKVYPLKTKDQATEYTEAFLQFVALQAQITINELTTVCTDGGGEFTNRDFRRFTAARGLRHQHTALYTSSQNGVAERAIRTVTEIASAMLIGSQLPHYLWEDAIQHAAYIRNRLPKRNAPTTPHERLFGSRPDFSNLPVFGQAVVVRTPEPLRQKRFRFRGRGVIGAFIGFSESVKVWRSGSAKFADRGDPLEHGARTAD
ncbi:hypothetical protein PR003_g29311 [Phytophthora rubi]|uniref:Integrase catalytic domain-containing protein n=1 Tax=Phytophthora rubi TaxID=129364 RepID=A0A6A4BN99_9STRA|nr:hypothetical protein PR003_g29311 [Phytophthora rubi]